MATGLEREGLGRQVGKAVVARVLTAHVPLFFLKSGRLRRGFGGRQASQAMGTTGKGNSGGG
jgi:hypothetical protein